MDTSYNHVQPVALGKKKNSNNNNNKTSNTSNPKTINPFKSNNPIGKQSGNTNKKRKSFPYQHADPVASTSNKWDLNSMGTSDSEERRRKRAERFNTNNANGSTANQGNGLNRVPSKNSFDPLNDMEDFSNLNAIATKSHAYDKNKHIIGTCQTIEKSYLRLTSEPNPELVRPLAVLQKAFALLIEKHKKHTVTYTYLCDQFKAIRQDLRVQMIENKFTVLVYETHARLALENGDLGEYNQCQSRLLILYEDNSLKNANNNFAEFISYLILYYILTDDNSAIMALRLKLRQDNTNTFKSKMVQNSFSLADAKLKGNYHVFMKICDTITTLGKHLINAFIEKEILRSLNTICSSYNQIGLDFLTEEFHFPSVNAVDFFLRKKGFGDFIKVKNQGEVNEFKYLDTKSSKALASALYQSSRKIDLKGQK
ncbi:similar to Saccharomyces cerevisiae YPR045C THP3 Protein that forms a complex with Csn12p that is recruited to transcribed genes and may have a role in transcription elongation [Maudiozyma barnettii]|uniref:Similar to Saccharomyces cerevisiae YPR045C THP3 Protein that forms a complex with Csn12p that is recruited to transcribed genes and may have a role in transcription elongation n=1 Tax=Maudiozyma barnettii TaxID=61262 RepID=A0A8H2ZGU3_9SACH|nr:Thp3p [Kazachstania barnettii]CAB4254979.1 similar to Saccharomyces cerevisiae YPR045C THP3 Protein that forms a complex with Csn12p that is recruited to transcribed genes and may have a role in transcription elongation [Kazachstania barnettii]CAD1783250.1 similar to Saccharomyces cerevisiae YPR045C THP3 Protein that forms a complex with Csn12p that is recruited to transcribed genes and may have a role in transcription elongation [Kazachstania barnettii]